MGRYRDVASFFSERTNLTPRVGLTCQRPSLVANLAYERSAHSAWLYVAAEARRPHLSGSPRNCSTSPRAGSRSPRYNRNRSAIEPYVFAVRSERLALANRRTSSRIGRSACVDMVPSIPLIVAWRRTEPDACATALRTRLVALAPSECFGAALRGQASR
jgi:hypothetical protein